MADETREKRISNIVGDQQSAIAIDRQSDRTSMRVVVGIEQAFAGGAVRRSMSNLGRSQRTSLRLRHIVASQTLPSAKSVTQFRDSQ